MASPTPDGDDLQARLESLSASLQKRETRDSEGVPGRGAVDGGSFGRAMSLGFRVLAEFVAGVVVGGVIGWQLDRWLSTSPLFLILFLGLGTAAGFWNVYRIAMTTSGKPLDRR